MVSSPKEQRKRCDKLMELAVENLDKYLSADGEWVKELPEMSMRVYLGVAQVYLRSRKPENIRKANLLIVKSVPNRCHFAPMTALQILTKYGTLLSEEARERLRTYAEAHMEEFAGDDMDFLGVNDNFPSMATYSLVMGGQVLERPELVERGRERLRQFQSLFTRRGVASEYNSPTYSPFQLLAMAELANDAWDEEIRRMAMGCEQRIWADVLGHFHKETSQIAGPYSRAYANNSSGSYSGAMCISLYALLGEAIPINIYRIVTETEDGTNLAQANLVGLTDTVYSCPPEWIDFALHKQYPYEMWGTTEFTSSTDVGAGVETPVWAEGELANYEYPAGNGKIYTYMTEDYALGTATHEFHNGIQTDSCHLLYRRSVPAMRQEDIGTVYTRYLVNEKMPSPEMVLLEDDGRKLGIQHKNAAMVLYKPKAFLGKDVHSLKLSLVIPGNDGQPGEVWLGEQRMEGEALSVKEPCTVYIKDGPVYMAFQPLLLTNHGREDAVTARWENGFLLISFYNYAGPVRDFNMKEMLLTGNGFLAEVSSQAEAGSFEAFRQNAGGFIVRDEWQCTIHSRFSTIRKTCCSKGDLEFSCEYSPVTEGIKHISVNGQPLPEDKLYMSGFDCSTLPFL